MRKILRVALEKLEGGFDFVFNEALVTVGSFIANLFTLSLSLFYALTNTLPIIPQWAWFAVFLFMLVAGTYSLQDLLYMGYDEDGNKIEDEDEDYEPEDDEIVPD